MALGACVVGVRGVHGIGGMHGGGNTQWEACMAEGTCIAGGMCGRVCVWQCVCVCDRDACMVGDMHSEGSVELGGHAWLGVHGGGLWWGGICGGGGACVTGEMATAAGGTHPTGMHSSWKYQTHYSNKYTFTHRFSLIQDVPHNKLHRHFWITFFPRLL